MQRLLQNPDQVQTDPKKYAIQQKIKLLPESKQQAAINLISTVLQQRNLESTQRLAASSSNSSSSAAARKPQPAQATTAQLVAAAVPTIQIHLKRRDVIAEMVLTSDEYPPREISSACEFAPCTLTHDGLKKVEGILARENQLKLENIQVKEELRALKRKRGSLPTSQQADYSNGASAQRDLNKRDLLGIMFEGPRTTDSTTITSSRTSTETNSSSAARAIFASTAPRIVPSSSCSTPPLRKSQLLDPTRAL